MSLEHDRPTDVPRPGGSRRARSAAFAPGEGSDERIVRRPELSAITGLSSMSTDRLEAAGKFPKRVVLGPNSVGWVLGEVRAWVRHRVAARDRAPRPTARDAVPPPTLAAASSQGGRAA